MLYKKITILSISFVVLIFISQAFLIYRLYNVNRLLLNRELNLISQEAYNIDLNKRFKSYSDKEYPKVYMGGEVSTAGSENTVYNLDKMSGVEKSNTVTLVNIAMEMHIGNDRPIHLPTLDSIATVLLKRDGFNSDFYSRIVDTKNNKILASSRKGIQSPTSLIQSKNIPLNFQQTKVIQFALLNPMQEVFSQMTGMLILSFFLSLFCIYCLFILQRTLAKQKKLSQSKNDFYNQVSHELKRPVSIMHTAIDSLLYTKAIDDKNKREKYLGISMDELNRMNGKIDMILTMSMEEEGMFRLNLSKVNLTEAILEIKKRFLETASKPLGILFDVPAEECTILADKEHIYQCISNLIENAIKYSGDNVEVVIGLSRKSNATVISVRDNGIGIKEEDLSKIFEKFARVSSDKKMHGYGIGLNYVKQIIEKHGGNITVKSEFGKGSEFLLELPVGQIN